MMDFSTSVTKAAGITGEEAVAKAIASRREIFEKTATAEAAVLRPHAPGGLSHDLRAALAARIAAANNEPAEAARYLGGVANAETAKLAAPGSTSADPRTQAILRFTDAVATNPRDVEASDVEALKAAGVEDADIVRAAELNAFLAYQLRLIAGLRLLAGVGK